MTERNLKVDLFEGEEYATIILDNWKDPDGVAYNWVTAAANTIQMRVSTAEGSGTTVFTKTAVDTTETTTRLTIDFADTDMGANAVGSYWWELKADFGNGLQQIVAPSPFNYKSSTTA